MILGIDIGGITYWVDIDTEDDFVTDVNSVSISIGSGKTVQVQMTRKQLNEFYDRYYDDLNEKYKQYIEALREGEAEQRYGKNN